jgi:hypothetical protein
LQEWRDDAFTEKNVFNNHYTHAFQKEFKARRKEKNQSGLPKSLAVLLKTPYEEVRRKFFNQDTKQWSDTYLDQQRRYPTVSGPLNVSFDAIYPWVAVEGKSRCHVPQNVVPTAQYVNFLKGTSLPLLLPL